jgi:hypothetical protein
MKVKYPSKFWQGVAKRGDDPGMVMQYMIRRYIQLGGKTEDLEKIDQKSRDKRSEGNEG